VTALAQRIGVAAADAAALVVPIEGPPTPTDPPASPLLAMMAPNGASGAPRIRLIGQWPSHRLTVQDYHRLAEAGTFHEVE
jgi:hypothetical protein